MTDKHSDKLWHPNCQPTADVGKRSDRKGRDGTFL